MFSPERHKLDDVIVPPPPPNAASTSCSTTNVDSSKGVDDPQVRSDAYHTAAAKVCQNWLQVTTHVCGVTQQRNNQHCYAKAGVGAYVYTVVICRLCKQALDLGSVISDMTFPTPMVTPPCSKQFKHANIQIEREDLLDSYRSAFDAHVSTELLKCSHNRPVCWCHSHLQKFDAGAEDHQLIR